MLTLKVPLKDAQAVKRKLVSENILNMDYNPLKEGGFIFFPVNKRFSSKNSTNQANHQLLNPQFLEIDLAKKPERKSLKESLKSKLSEEEMELLKRSMDTIGTIAIIEIPDELRPRETLIAEEALRLNKNIKTVLRKGKHGGVFRTQELEWLAGDKTKETIYKENGITLKIDVERVYFSPRLSHERERIANLIKKGEDVLVMFSGCAPYVCVISKNTSAASVGGIEINPAGHEYALENLKINKLKNARVFCGDVREVAPTLKKKYDRILMPLPKTADEYLDVAIACAKKGAVIHFYDFEQEVEVQNGVDKIAKACNAAKKKYKLLDTVKAGQHGPRAYRYCFDFRVE